MLPAFAGRTMSDTPETTLASVDASVETELRREILCEALPSGTLRWRAGRDRLT